MKPTAITLIKLVFSTVMGLGFRHPNVQREA